MLWTELGGRSIMSLVDHLRAMKRALDRNGFRDEDPSWRRPRHRRDDDHEHF
jgi:hypothetical protein